MIYLKTSIGIELDGKDMVLSSLQGNLSSGTLKYFARISDYRTRDPEEVRQEIQFFLKNNALTRENIVVGIPRQDVLLRHLELPLEVADNLKQVIRYQVQSFEPTEEDSYYYDYAQLGKSQKNKRITVLLTMVRKSLLDEHLQRLLNLGIRPAFVTCSSIALANLYLQSRKNIQDKTCILANATPRSLELLVLRNGAPVYSQETPKEDRINWKDLILQETNEAVSRIRLGNDSTIEEFILAGQAAETALAELKEAIPECILMKDTIPVKSSEEYAPYLQEASAAIGLAFTGMAKHTPLKLNLLPAAFRFKQPRWAYVSAAILGLITLLAGIFFHPRIQNHELAQQLDQEIAARKPEVDKVLQLRKETQELAKEIEFIEKIYRKRDRNLEVLNELTQLLPEDTYLNNYRYQNGKITIQGLSNSASDLILILESSPLLKDVGQRGSTTRDQASGKERFQIEATLEE
jgi:Tfp pilus assembly protein PilN